MLLARAGTMNTIRNQFTATNVQLRALSTYVLGTEKETSGQRLHDEIDACSQSPEN